MQEDFGRLIGAVLPPAQAMIKDLSGFIPFGAMVAQGGEVQLAGGAGDASQWTTEEIIGMYHEGFRDGVTLGFYRALALCVDVRVTVPGRVDKTDALQIMLEHESGEALHVFLPYQKALDDRVEFGQMFATPAEPQVFAKPN
jgi:hypothetical protein